MKIANRVMGVFENDKHSSIEEAQNTIKNSDLLITVFMDGFGIKTKEEVSAEELSLEFINGMLEKYYSKRLENFSFKKPHEGTNGGFVELPCTAKWKGTEDSGYISIRIKVNPMIEEIIDVLS